MLNVVGKPNETPLLPPAKNPDIVTHDKWQQILQLSDTELIALFNRKNPYKQEDSHHNWRRYMCSYIYIRDVRGGTSILFERVKRRTEAEINKEENKLKNLQ